MVIENQWSQFAAIRGFLEKMQASVYPDDNTFVKLMDCVRIVLLSAHTYSAKKRADAENVLIEEINNYNPELLLIDYNLIGQQRGGSGIDLYVALKDRFNSAYPVLFMSRLALDPNGSIDEAELVTKGFGPRNWITKGFGDTEPDEFYFTNTVFNRIVEITNIGNSAKVNHPDPLTSLNKILSYSIYRHSKHFPAIRDSKNTFKFNDTQTTLIIRFMNENLSNPSVGSFDVFALQFLQAEAQ